MHIICTIHSEIDKRFLSKIDHKGKINPPFCCCQIVLAFFFLLNYSLCECVCVCGGGWGVMRGAGWWWAACMYAYVYMCVYMYVCVYLYFEFTCLLTVGGGWGGGVYGILHSPCVLQKLWHTPNFHVKLKAGVKNRVSTVDILVLVLALIRDFCEICQSTVSKLLFFDCQHFLFFCFRCCAYQWCVRSPPTC